MKPNDRSDLKEPYINIHGTLVTIPSPISPEHTSDDTYTEMDTLKNELVKLHQTSMSDFVIQGGMRCFPKPPLNYQFSSPPPPPGPPSRSNEEAKQLLQCVQDSIYQRCPNSDTSALCAVFKSYCTVDTPGAVLFGTYPQLDQEALREEYSGR